jgi:hypothetical protein
MSVFVIVSVCVCVFVCVWDLVIFLDGCEHKKSCCRWTAAVRQELYFEFPVRVQHQATFCHVHADRRLQVPFTTPIG